MRSWRGRRGDAWRVDAIRRDDGAGAGRTRRHVRLLLGRERIYLILEYAPGGEPRKRLTAKGRFSEQEMTRYVLEMA